MTSGCQQSDLESFAASTNLRGCGGLRLVNVILGEGVWPKHRSWLEDCLVENTAMRLEIIMARREVRDNGH